MPLLRSLLFAVLLGVWTLALGLLFLPLLLLAPRRMGQFVPFFWTHGIITLARLICGIRVRVEGMEHLAHGAAIYAVKHQSALETFFLWQILPVPVFVLKKELLRVPVFGPYLARTPIIAIDRKAGKAALSSLLTQARQHLEMKRQIVIFPEGSRSAPGSKHTYKSGIFALYEDSGLPVIPVALNSGLCWGKSSVVKKPGTVTLRLLPPIPPGMERDAFMHQLEETIERESLSLLT